MKTIHVITVDHETKEVVVETLQDGKSVELFRANNYQMSHNRELDYHRETPDGPVTTIVPTGRESWHFIITKEPEHEG